MIGGAFVSLILITLFYLYPAKTLATIVIVSSVIAGFLSFALFSDVLGFIALIFLISQLLLFTFFYDGLMIIYPFVIGIAFIGSTVYLHHILKLYLDINKDK